VLDHEYPHLFHRTPQTEQSVIVFGAMEAALTPLMERIEQEHPGIRVFSLPSVDHPQYGRHIELGVKGSAADVPAAWADLQKALHNIGANCGPELVRQLP
jgi:molybdopterin-biosynthesis enzyme MoeA-like protein